MRQVCSLCAPWSQGKTSHLGSALCDVRRGPMACWWPYDRRWCVLRMFGVWGARVAGWWVGVVGCGEWSVGWWVSLKCCCQPLHPLHQCTRFSLFCVRDRCSCDRGCCRRLHLGARLRGGGRAASHCSSVPPAVPGGGTGHAAHPYSRRSGEKTQGFGQSVVTSVWKKGHLC